MRIIAGEFKGRVIDSPSERTTRPTTDRVRESIFSSVYSRLPDLTDVIVLDAFAGSGALGIEALSRGAASCLFVDSSHRACTLVRENLRRAGFAQRGQVVAAHVGRWRPAAGRSFSLVLADPPYDDAAAWSAIEYSVADALTEDAVLVVEHSARREPPAALMGRPLWRDRRQGDGAVALYRWPGAVGVVSGVDSEASV